MNHAMPMKVSSAVYAVFGLALFFAPNALLALYKAPEMNGPGIYNSMLLGATFLGLAAATWVASGLTAAAARPVMLAALIGNSLGMVAGLYRQLSDASVPASSWLNVAIMLGFAVLYARLYFGRAVQPVGSPA